MKFNKQSKRRHIYQNSIDDILGYVHSFELFNKPKTIKNIMIPVEYIPETIFIKDALDLLTKKKFYLIRFIKKK